MEALTQDPKFIILDGSLANSATREFIPEDEPVFIVRGKDMHAAELLRVYGEMCANENHREAVAIRELEFIQFAEENPDVMGEPDTAGAKDWPDKADGPDDDKGDGTEDDQNDNGKED